MELIPHDELQSTQSFNFAPMIDFLFLMLALFAILAVSRAALNDTEIDLVQLKSGATSLKGSDIHQVNLSITSEGNFKWLTEFQKYPMENVQAIQTELARQYQIGALPAEKEKTEVLLHIDQKAPWGAIANAIFAIKEIGFTARPVHTPKDEKLYSDFSSSSELQE